MTGAGTAVGATELGRLSIEFRSVNGRGLSVKMRLAAECQGLEAAVEERLRRRIQRGSVQVASVVDDPASGPDTGLNIEFGLQVAQRLDAFAAQVGKTVSLADILAFPGVVEATARSRPRMSRELPAEVAALVDLAVHALVEDRQREGQATVAAMLLSIDDIDAALAEVRVLAPQIVGDYRDRVLQRVNEFLDGRAKTLQPEEVIREVSVFADRVDITEEIQRLASHMSRAREVLQDGGVLGRNFEFLVQEMLREVNTLGSKSPDVQIAHLVVRMKSGVDRLKEQAANLE